MKKILTISIAVLMIIFIFLGTQSVIKRFNLARNNNTLQNDIVIDQGTVIIGNPYKTKTPSLQETEEPEPVVAGKQIEQKTEPIIAEQTLEAEQEEIEDDPPLDIKIKIIKQPHGEEPDWVKQTWVGLEIPVIKGTYAQKGGQEVLSKDFRAADNYVTYVEEALAILKAKNPAAEQWWRDNVDLVGVDYIAFDRDVCELVGVD